jgi:hypothetical protein
MSAAEGTAILNAVFRTILTHLVKIVAAAKPKLPGLLGLLVSPQSLQWIFRYTYAGISDIPEAIKSEIAISVKRELGMVEDSYVRSVLHKQANPEMAAILQATGDLVEYKGGDNGSL